MNEFKVIDGFNGKYEINANGVVRNVKTQKETKVHHVSKKLGPIVSLTAGETDARLSVLVLVKELFGTTVPGWEEVDLTAKAEATVVKTVLTPELKADREAAKLAAKTARDIARAAKKSEKEAAVQAAKDAANKIRADKAAAKAAAQAVIADVAPEAAAV